MSSRDPLRCLSPFPTSCVRGAGAYPKPVATWLFERKIVHQEAPYLTVNRRRGVVPTLCPDIHVTIPVRIPGSVPMESPSEDKRNAGKDHACVVGYAADPEAVQGMRPI